MKKPREAIERMRAALDRGSIYGEYAAGDVKSILAYLDSIPEGAHVCVWPKELTRERMLELARDDGMARWPERSEALRALAHIAPEAPKKRMVEIWTHEDGTLSVHDLPIDPARNAWGQRKRHGPFEIED